MKAPGPVVDKLPDTFIGVVPVAVIPPFENLRLKKLFAPVPDKAAFKPRKATVEVPPL